MRILLVEDDNLIAETLQELLSENYAVVSTSLGKEALELVEKTPFDAIILDLGLPDMPGDEVCKQIRNLKISTPILILTGQHETEFKVSALDGGADDYITKPYNFDELSARLRAILRRHTSTEQSKKTSLDLVLNTQKRIAIRKGTEIILRKKEFDILEYLVSNQGRVVTRNMILNHVWHDEEEGAFSNIVDVHIKYLRDRIEKPFNSQLIKTVHGMGYTIPA